MRDIFERAQKVADVASTTVLILGETGTGKGMLSKAIHRLSKRSEKPYVEINCSAIPEQLLESELFGHEKGAFTDAKAAKLGLLEIANEGTVFLGEIGDMAINLQSKLLKVIEDKEFRRVGSGRTTSVDIRIIAATSRNLQQLVKDGRFREDLYYRLSVIPIVLPPLREHRSSVPPLAEYYLAKASREVGRTFDGIDKEAMEALLAYAWPGNVRELRNVFDRSVILESSSTITRASLGLPGGEEAPPAEEASSTVTAFSPMTLADSERELIAKTLAHESGNKNKAAGLLGIHRTTLYKKIDEYGLDG
jgi:transcriptional regulator with PAS, ATPase and Fis domain